MKQNNTFAIAIGCLVCVLGAIWTLERIKTQDNTVISGTITQPAQDFGRFGDWVIIDIRYPPVNAGGTTL